VKIIWVDKTFTENPKQNKLKQNISQKSKEQNKTFQ
jgi:hypothetical protein